MDWLGLLNATVAMIGIPTIAIVLVNIGRKLNTLDTIERDLRDSIRPDLKDVRDRFLVVEDHVETLWKDKIAPAHSPRQLNAAGEEILANSGIKGIVDMKKKVLFDLVTQAITDKKIDNAYDAEKEIESIMNKLPEYCPDVLKPLKDGAFKVGYDVPVVLFVGSIYLRNLIFKDLGFELDEIDVRKKA